MNVGQILETHLGWACAGLGKQVGEAVNAYMKSRDVQPLRKLKLGDLDVEMWYGVLAPKGTPAPVVERLNREIKAILALPEVTAAFETQGMTPASSTPAEFQALISKDAARWAKVIKDQNITAD